MIARCNQSAVRWESRENELRKSENRIHEKKNHTTIITQREKNISSLCGCFLLYFVEKSMPPHIEKQWTQDEEKPRKKKKWRREAKPLLRDYGNSNGNEDNVRL